MRKAVFVSVLLLLSLGVFLAVHLIIFSDNKLHIVFCDVGQGDAVLIRSSSGIVSLVDGGPDESVLNCLSNHLPFWQRTISLMLLSHPHADHYVGMLGIIDNYMVKNFVTERLNNDTVLFSAFLERIKIKKIPSRHLYAGDVFRFKDGLVIQVLGPSKEYLRQTSPNGQIGEKAEFASLVLLVTYHDFSLLLTGDSQVTGIDDALRNSNIGKVSVLQVPHHGSRTGLDGTILDRIKPKLAVISVGKNNYGHPSPQIEKILRDQDVKIVKTIENGDVEIVSDGKKWFMK